MQFDKVNALVEKAKTQDATIVCGGPGYFYPVTLVTDIADGASLVDEEQFGPVLPIIRYKHIDEAIQSAKRLAAGLSALAWINQHGATHPMVPFGGIKGSGYGVEFGIDGLKAVTVP
jgi:acyl-CoA reductase-like NAD-dependent aldehyde dehydrogenase